MATLTPNKDAEVTITKQGTTTTEIVTTTITGGVTNNDDYTIPVGKSIDLFGYSNYAFAGITIGAWSIQIKVDGTNFYILANGTGETAGLLQFPISLKAGDIVRFRTILAHTSDADYISRLLFNSRDA